MPYKFLTLEGLGRLGTRLKAVLTAKATDESITGQYTFQAKPLFNLDTAAIDDAVLPPGNLRFIDVTNNQEIGDLYLKDTENLYYDLETAPPVDGYDFVSMEYDPLTEKYNLFYIPLTNPVVSSSSQMISYISQGVIPNTKNLSTIDFYGLSSSITEIPRFYAKNATKINFAGTKITTIPQIDSSNITGSVNSQGIFFNCNELVSLPLFNTSKFTSIQSMFYNCSKLVSIPSFDFSNATNCEYLFNNCTSLRTIPDLNLSRANSLLNSFYGCSSLVEISSLNTSVCTSFNSTFSYCTGLEVINGLYMGSCSDTGYMFFKCTSLREVHIDFGNNSNSSLNTLFNNLTFGSNQMINLYVKNIPQSVRSAIQSNYGAHVTIIEALL